LHSGKGTGVSSLFGAGMPSSATGTGMIEKNLDRITIAFAAGYGLTALVLMLTWPASL
jgi:preprotein translocase subunit SecG